GTGFYLEAGQPRCWALLLGRRGGRRRRRPGSRLWARSWWSAQGCYLPPTADAASPLLAPAKPPDGGGVLPSLPLPTRLPPPGKGRGKEFRETRAGSGSTESTRGVTPCLTRQA
ncbi:unnamed protein product, partial [Heterosigma akashiwo]